MQEDSLSVWIRKHRRNADLTQQEAADAAGVSLTYLGALERGQGHPQTGKAVRPSRETVLAIARAVGGNADEALRAAGYVPMQPPAQGYIADDLGFPVMAVTVPKLTYTHGDSAPRNVLVEPTYEPSDDIAEIWAYYDGMPPEMQAEVKEDLRRKFLAAKARGSHGKRSE